VGVETEMRMPFAGLHQLLHGQLDEPRCSRTERTTGGGTPDGAAETTRSSPAPPHARAARPFLAWSAQPAGRPRREVAHVTSGNLSRNAPMSTS
jgi:hypothetical protein